VSQGESGHATRFATRPCRVSCRVLSQFFCKLLKIIKTHVATYVANTCGDNKPTLYKSVVCRVS
jgi:hypothetical protein